MRSITKRFLGLMLLTFSAGMLAMLIATSAGASTAFLLAMFPWVVVGAGGLFLLVSFVFYLKDRALLNEEEEFGYVKGNKGLHSERLLLVGFALGLIAVGFLLHFGIIPIMVLALPTTFTAIAVWAFVGIAVFAALSIIHAICRHQAEEGSVSGKENPGIRAGLLLLALISVATVTILLLSGVITVPVIVTTTILC